MKSRSRGGRSFAAPKVARIYSKFQISNLNGSVSMAIYVFSQSQYFPKSRDKSPWKFNRHAQLPMCDTKPMKFGCN